MFIYFGAAQILRQSQPVYGDVIYSPFSGIDYRYNKIEVTLDYGSESSNNKYNLTICQAQCPLRTHTKQLVYNGSCINHRSQINCYAKLSEEDFEPDSYPQCFSEYMMKNSKVTLKITELNLNFSVQLCVTTNKDKCGHVFQSGNLTQPEYCLELKTFNKTNHLTQTFTVPYNSNYCAVWLLGSSDQWLSYTVNSSIEMYNMTDYSPHTCKSFYEGPSQINFPLCPHTTCIVLQQNIVNRWDPLTCDSITVNSTAFVPLGDVAWIAFSVIMGLVVTFCMILSIVSFIIIKCIVNH